MKTDSQILAFHMDPERFSEISAICEKLGLICRNIPEKEDTVPLGLLCHLPMQRPGPLPEGGDLPLSEEMLLLCCVPGTVMDRFLKELRRCRMTVPLKAVLTETNVLWNARILQHQIRQEAGRIAPLL